MSVVEQRDVVVVEGSQAGTYLHGQLSASVTDLEVGASRWSFLLEPSGKLGFLVRVRRVADESFELDAPDGMGDAVEARLRRFFLRTKASFSRSSRCVDVDGDGDGEALAGWSEGSIQRITDTAASAIELLDERRVSLGWPGTPELTDGIIPGETLLVPIAVAFGKGCYTGQELVARIDSRGNNVPKLLRLLELSGAAAPGDALSFEGEPVAQLTTVSGQRALAYVPRRFDDGAVGEVNGSAARVVPIR